MLALQSWKRSCYLFTGNGRWSCPYIIKKTTTTTRNPMPWRWINWRQDSGWWNGSRLWMIWNRLRLSVKSWSRVLCMGPVLSHNLPTCCFHPGSCAARWQGHHLQKFCLHKTRKEPEVIEMKYMPIPHTWRHRGLSNWNLFCYQALLFCCELIAYHSKQWLILFASITRMWCKNLLNLA